MPPYKSRPTTPHNHLPPAPSPPKPKPTRPPHPTPQTHQDMAYIYGPASTPDLQVCALMADQIKANARVLFGCHHSYDIAIGHGDDGGFRALLFRHDAQSCSPDGPTGTKFQELRKAHALLRLAIAPTRREAVQSVLAWTEGLVSGKVGE
ncbi:hypothetical protein GTA08_BOTSDO06980 [Botryosphaeria dothidea]|uniref:Uncharacterized protein n=1 Tax=Botryosphaeria dothidea TaxID=55169 RepID=A0A8H4N3X4_9PEZI|nr:hypothetical protein GTA08_BOTSDO06980 [Botryosphaeria dothidea]